MKFSSFDFPIKPATSHIKKSIELMSIISKLPRDGKTASSRKTIWEIGRKEVRLAIKSVSTSQNKEFVVKIY